MSGEIRAQISLYIQALPNDVYTAFVEPAILSRFWLSAASGPLRIGEQVHWEFMVDGAETNVKAVTMDPGKRLAWEWDGSAVSIEFEPLDGGTAVILVNDSFLATGREAIDAVIDATEGFSFVLADLKTLLETGISAGIVAAKAKLIERARG
jgi:uncharacterized protein YndB with AHSA1/START domain